MSVHQHDLPGLHHPLVAPGDLHEPVVLPPGGHVAPLGQPLAPLLLVDEEHLPAAPLAPLQDRRAGHQDPVRKRLGVQGDLGVHARLDPPVGIGQEHRHPPGARLGIHHRVDGGDPSLEALSGIRGEGHLRAAALGQGPQLGLQHLHLHLDGIQVHHGHELGAGAHVLPLHHLDVGDAAAEGRLYPGAGQLDLRLLERHLALLQAAPAPGDALPLGPHLRVLDLVVEEDHLPVVGLRREEVRTGLLQLEGVLGGVQAEKQLSLDHPPVLPHRQGFDESLHLGLERGAAVGLGLPGGAHPDPEGVPDHLDACHGLGNIGGELGGRRALRQLGRLGLGGLAVLALVALGAQAKPYAGGQRAEDEQDGDQAECTPRKAHARLMGWSGRWSGMRA